MHAYIMWTSSEYACMQYERINNLDISITVMGSYTIRRQTYDMYNVLRKTWMHWHKASPAGPKHLSLEESLAGRADSVWQNVSALRVSAHVTVISPASWVSSPRPTRAEPPRSPAHAGRSAQETLTPRHARPCRTPEPHSALRTAHRTPHSGTGKGWVIVMTTNVSFEGKMHCNSDISFQFSKPN